MMRPRLAPACLVAALAVGGVAPAGAAVEPSAPLARLVAPRPGAVLAAGADASLEWAPLGGWEEHGSIEEWEAFLSVDGGRRYTVRITPHLDLAVHRIRWRVPPLPTRDARLLLRFGDERRELAFEVPGSLAIELPPWLPATPVLPMSRPGEAARDGEPGVHLWVEGDRRGVSLRYVRYEGRGVTAEEPAAQGPRLTALPPGGDRSTSEPPAAPLRHLARHADRPPSGRARPLPPPDLRLLIGRQNE